MAIYKLLHNIIQHSLAVTVTTIPSLPRYFF